MGILNRNKKKTLGIGLADHGRKSPLSVDDQDSPQPERMTRPDEEAEVSISEMKDPPQAEGDRSLDH